MTREEYLAKVEEIKDEYVKLAKDYVDALLKEDFKKAAEISFSTVSVLGADLSAYIADKVMALGNYDELVDNYIDDCHEIEALMTDE